MAGMKLIVRRGPEQGQERQLAGTSAVVGRGSGCDIVLTDDQISRRHAELSESGGRWYVSDLGSANGTFVNDRQLAQNERAPLGIGDRLRLGQRTEVALDLGGPPAAAYSADASAEGAGRTGEPGGARSKILIIGALLILLAIAAAGAWALLRNKGDTSGSAQTEPRSNTPGAAAAVVIGTKTPAGQGAAQAPAATATPLVQVKAGAGASGATLPAVTPPGVQANPPPAAAAPPAALPPTLSAATENASGGRPAEEALASGKQPAGLPPGINPAMGPSGLPLAIAAAFPNAKGEQLAPLLQQALQSGQLKPEAGQQYIGALFPGVPVAQLPNALAGSFAGFSPQQIEQILNAIYPGQNLKPPEIATGKGSVAFTVWENEQASIYLMNADGSGRQLLIAQASEPAFSPNGKRLAYFSWRADALGLRIRDMDSGKDVQLTSNDNDLYPTWAPDGGRLAFWDWPSGISTINADGSNRRGISPGEFPAWSPAGDRIALKGCVANDCGIVLVNPDGSNPVRITNNANDGQPAWSPDGRDIAFVSNRDGNWEIYAVKADGSWLRRITDDIHTDGLPAWASDGIRIAFRSDRTGTWAIYTASGVGGPPIKLVDAPVRTTGGWPWTVEKISWR